MALPLLLALTGCEMLLYEDDNLHPTGVCGDGDYDVNFEGCDDGNVVDGDGCTATCRLQPSVRATWSYAGLAPRECPAGHARAQLRMEAENPEHSFTLEAPCTDGVMRRYTEHETFIVSMAILDANGAELLVSYSETRGWSVPLYIQRTFTVP